MRYDQSGHAKRVKTGGYQWSDEAEDEFFEHLAATCNVRASAEAVGFTAPTVYRQRRLRPDFADKWKAVLVHAYARLEMALVEAAVDSLDGVEFDADRPIPKMTVEEAMNLLKLHGPEVRGERRGPGRYARRRTLDEVRGSIARKVEAILKARDPFLRPALRQAASPGPAAGQDAGEGAGDPKEEGQEKADSGSGPG